MIGYELDLARNRRGVLSEDVRRRLAAYWCAPSAALWDDICGIIVGADGWMTVWQAWMEIDPAAPKRGRSWDHRNRLVAEWLRWPTRTEFERALRFATH